MKNIAIIVPSLNPDKQLNIVVDGMTKAGFNNIILVDDGSAEEFKQPFKTAVSEHPSCILLTHEVNRGKGCALKTAFDYILKEMPDVDGAITIDSDGQHTPEDAIRLARKMTECPDDIVFGCRNFDEEQVPFHNKIGNKITAAVFKLGFKMNISDAQTGLRGFPRKYLAELIEVEGERYEYESNMLMYMSEKDIPFSEIKISTLYIDDNKSSHFNVIKDSIRIYKPILYKATSIKYILSSLFATLIDATVFTILNSVFNDRRIDSILLLTLITTGIARIISASVNYIVNYRWVFHSDASAAGSAAKYVLAVIGHYILAYFTCSGLFALAEMVGIVGFGRTIIKLLVDCLLFFATYAIQKKWVFK